MERELKEFYEEIFNLLIALSLYFYGKSILISNQCKDIATKLDKMIIEGILE